MALRHTFMADLKRKLSLLISILVSGFCIILFALNVTELWIAWLLTFGFFLGSALASQMAKLAVNLCVLSILAIITTLISRRLPIYTLDWAGADSVEISDLGETWKVTLSDPQEINALMNYGDSGHYQSMIKGGTNFHLYVTHRGAADGYYIYGNSIGRLPGGFGQTVFVPKRDGLMTGLKGVLARHGHGEQVP